MSVMSTFLAYAKDFEATYLDDDWQRLEKYFVSEAVYDVENVSFACRLEGTEAIFKGIKKSLDNFDRAMDSRVIEATSAPSVRGDVFEVDWAVTYSKGDAPLVRILATSSATVRGGRMVHLVDRYLPGQDDQLLAWLEAYASELDPSYI